MQSSQRGPCAEPWLEVNAPEAERLFALSQPQESANLSYNLVFCKTKSFVGCLAAMAHTCPLSPSLQA